MGGNTAAELWRSRHPGHRADHHPQLGRVSSATFKNLPEGSTFSVSGQTFRISYAGSNVTLTADVDRTQP